MNQYRVRLSEIAQERLHDILEYIELEWSTNSRNKFLKKFDEKIDQISRLPKSCPESIEEQGLFKGVVEKHVSFFYRINNEYIDILLVFDNRQSPEKIQEIIRKAHKST